MIGLWRAGLVGWKWIWAKRKAFKNEVAAIIAAPSAPSESRDNTPFELPGGTACQVSHLMAAAGNHLNRVDKLADTEWKVTLAFWAAMLASGASLIGVAGGSKPQIAYLIYSNSAAILAIYLAGVSIFIFGFSSNQSQSIYTERNRFLTYQAAALKAAGVADSLIIPVDPPMGAHSPLARVPRAQTRRSPVWAMKLAASTSFVLTITGTAVVLAGVRATEWPSTVTMGSLWAALNFVAAGCIGFLWLELVARFLARARASRQ